MSQETTGSREFTGYHMIGVISLFFGVIVAVNLTLAFFAANSWTGLVVENSYIASQFFDDDKRVREQQLALGWQSDFRYEQGVVTLDLVDVNGAVVRADKIEVKLGRPVHETDDVLLTLSQGLETSYTAEIDLGAGVWQADMTAYLAGQVIWTNPVRFVVEQ
ncbi:MULTISPECIES: FixH family protein [unclassified Lentilitoribacter]|jgi:nitrogen fixation protein FixH|uniref:FixH family protein n=1 Tax=unclassified Lentilitoribacter TaxID=2647570 RepID=UPI0013A68C8E|nr:FixH family protein [Lentilitoribacter sp. Alg239-R112]